MMLRFKKIFNLDLMRYDYFYNDKFVGYIDAELMKQHPESDCEFRKRLTLEITKSYKDK